MKIIALLTALLCTMISIGTHASEFDGSYVGVNLGNNRATMDSKPNKNSAYLGVKAGHNLDFDGFLVGAEVFADNHTKSYTGPDSGAAVRFGLPMNRWLPYARLGIVGNGPGYRPQGGLGVEYKPGNRWSVYAEWMTDSKDFAGVTLKNSNFAIGLNISLEAARAGIMPPVAPISATAADNSADEKAAAERMADKRAPASDKAPARPMNRIFF
jgi:outer membrane immunogenic protein